MTIQKYNESMFYEFKKGRYKYIGEIESVKNYFNRKICTCCKMVFFTSKRSSKFCTKQCDDRFSLEKKLKILGGGHYISGECEGVVNIKTNNGGMFKVSCFDVESINRITWKIARDGYIVTGMRINGKYISFSMHRFILGAKKGDVVDHIDGDKSNNTRENLRIVNTSINALNRHRYTNKTGHGNIYMVGKSFLVSIKLLGKVKAKTFKKLDDAILFRDKIKSDYIKQEIEKLKRVSS